MKTKEKRIKKIIITHGKHAHIKATLRIFSPSSKHAYYGLPNFFGLAIQPEAL